MSFVPKDITTLSTVLSNTLDLASFIVNKQGHIAKYCKYDILCKHCGECGHIQRDCPAHKEETARKEYGDDFHEIIEGRNTRINLVMITFILCNGVCT
jgi:hypothetical protein